MLVSGADWAKVVYFKIYAALTGTAMHSSPVWMDACSLCVRGLNHVCLRHTLYSSVSHTYISHLICHWPSVPVEWGCLQTQALVMSPLNWGVSKLKPYIFRFPVNWELPSRTPRRGLVGVFRAILYITIYILCYISGGLPPPGTLGQGLVF